MVASAGISEILLNRIQVLIVAKIFALEKLNNWFIIY